MRTLVVLAHPEPRSFNAALCAVAVGTLRELGHEVEVSDLYRMRFAPVVDRGDFTTVRDPERMNVSLEQRHAAANGGLAPDVLAELEKLQRADLLILQFPLWWFGPPAILKGWIDRTFVSGVVYGRSALFEGGRLRGKRAMVSVTTGAPRSAFGRDALNGDILDILMPLHRGVLGFTGMTVLPPFVSYHVPYEGDEGRAGMLREYRRRLASLDELAPLPMPRFADHKEQLADDLKALAR
jgi:NAD(P)H dehydrogenase (quinone)